jgi:hypothetical protein
MTSTLHDPARRGGAGLPIVPHASMESLPAEILASRAPAIERVRASFLAEESGLGSVAPFAPAVQAGLEHGPSLFVEDHSSIALAMQYDIESIYAYRPLMLAGEGDLLAVVPPRHLDFEDYCRDTLGLGAVEIITPRRRPGGSVAEMCHHDAMLVERVAARARAAGRLNVIPYMGNGAAWRLAAAIAGRAGVEVRVAASPPSLTRRVNDKAWFARCATELLGHTAVPMTYAAHGMAALAGHVRSFARKHATVAVKLPDSAGSAGNFVLDGAELCSHGLAELRDHLGELLAARGWRGEFPLLATVWESPLVATPSAQLWIPPAGAGLPIIEGVFDQSVTGKGAQFSGATPTRLSLALQRRLAGEALCMGALFQSLGYVGRCSFDAIVLAGQGTEPDLHWIECNGRWGGVSIPMSLVNRLDREMRQSFVVVLVHDMAVARDLPAVLEALGDALYRPDRGGAIVLSPGFLHARGRLELLVLYRSADQAQAAAADISRRLREKRHTGRVVASAIAAPSTVPATRPTGR